jgi:hypothetical protein
VRSGLAEIIKYSSNSGQIEPPLAQSPSTVDMNARNRLQATCATSSDGAVQSAFWVNGVKKLTAASDKNSPILSGTIALFAATTPGSTTPTEAQFEDLAVAQM